MNDQILIDILNKLKKELSIDTSDEEYMMYLEEKVEKAYIIEKEHNFLKDDFIARIKKELPIFLGNYQKMKKNFEKAQSEDGLNFGISINFELVELFKIAEVCESDEEFIIMRDKYFTDLGNDPRFQGFDYIFPGLKDIMLDEVKNIRENILENVDCITPEWAGKMRMNIDSRKQLIMDGKINDEIFDFTYLEKMVNFARENNMKLRLHNIIWHSQFPSLLNDATKEETLLFLDAYMKKLNESFGEVIYTVDVLNEIASDTPDKVLRDSPWKDKLGEEYYIDILRLAKKNFENIPLAYNDYGEEQSEKRKNVIEIVNKIKNVEQKEGKILLDVLGIQSHYSNQTQDSDIKDAYEDYSKLGKTLQVSELDVTNSGDEKNIDFQTNRVFRTVLDTAAKYGVKLMNVWGVSSKVSWKSKKVNCFLDNKGNKSIYSKKILSCYSSKFKNQNSLNYNEKSNVTL